MAANTMHIGPVGCGKTAVAFAAMQNFLDSEQFVQRLGRSPRRNQVSRRIYITTMQGAESMLRALQTMEHNYPVQLQYVD